MKVPFWAYLLWFCVKNLLLLVTLPIWFPAALLVVAVMGAVVWTEDTYKSVKGDWQRRYGEKK